MRLDSTVMHMDQFYKVDGSDRLMAHTLSNTYYYNPTGKHFVDITDVPYTGTDTNFYSSEIMNDLYIYNNGVDKIKKWNMSASLVSDLGGATDFRVKSRILKYGERLNLYYTVETGYNYPQRVRWSKLGDPEDWTAAGAGWADLLGVMGSDFIQAAEKLGDYIIIYGERSIVLQEYKGDYNTPFGFSTRLSGVGLAAPRAIVNLGEEHIFLGWEDVYSYTGGRDVTSVGSSIRNELIASINPAYTDKCFMVYVEERDQIFLYIPTGTATSPNVYYVYDVVDKTWSKGIRSATSFGYYETKSSISWDEMTGSWQSHLGEIWNNRIRLANSPITLIGDNTGHIFQDDGSVYNVDIDAIDSWWDSKDFAIQEGYRRDTVNWMELNFEARGNVVDVYYSTDLGDSYTYLDSKTLTTDWVKYNVDFEVNAPQIRFRFRNTALSSEFRIREVEIGYLQATDRGV